MSSSLISIIVPCYNQAQYLDECLQSVLEQTFSNWECLIIDDGSPDQTEEIAKKWVEKEARFHYFKKENGGVSSARNFGIDRASGTYILPLDGDDKIGNDYLRLGLEKLEEGNDLVYCNAVYFGLRTGKILLKDHNFPNILKSNTIFSCAIFKKEKLNHLRYDEKMIYGYEDWEFWISFLSQPEMKVFRLNETLFFYRIKEVSRNENVKKDAEKDRSSTAYIITKHQEKYNTYFGNYGELLKEVSILKEENTRLMRIVNSKRHQFIDRFFQLIKR